MAPDTSTKTPPARAAVKKPATPRALQKRKLTVSEAADQWEKGKRMQDRGKPLMEEAKPVLLEHFEKTGADDYKGRIGWTWSGGGLVLDQEKVRKFLGNQLMKFQTRSKRSRSLQLLK